MQEMLPPWSVLLVRALARSRRASRVVGFGRAGRAHRGIAPSGAVQQLWAAEHPAAANRVRFMNERRPPPPDEPQLERGSSVSC